MRLGFAVLVGTTNSEEKAGTIQSGHQQQMNRGYLVNVPTLCTAHLQMYPLTRSKRCKKTEKFGVKSTPAIPTEIKAPLSVLDSIA